MTEAEAQANVRPLGCGVVAEPLRGSEDDLPELSTGQTAWLELKAEEGWPQIGPCRWLPGGVLVVEIHGMFGKETYVLDRNGEEL